MFSFTAPPASAMSLDSFNPRPVISLITSQGQFDALYYETLGEQQH